MPKMGLNVVYLTILANLSPLKLLKSPLYYQWSTSNGSYFLKSLHKLVLLETVFISFFGGGHGNVQTKYAHKSYIWPFWQIFESPTHSKALYTTNEVHLKAPIFPKVSINHYYQEQQKLYWFLTFMKCKCTKYAQKSYNWPFSPIFEPPNPLKSPLYYQWTT